MVQDTDRDIYSNMYLRSRVLYAIYHIYVYVRNVHVHIVLYKATWSRMKWFIRQFVDGSMEILTRLMK